MNQNERIELLEAKIKNLEEGNQNLYEREHHKTNGEYTLQKSTLESTVESRYLGYEDDIDIKELFVTLWKGRMRIIVVTLFFSVLSIFYALSLPNIYTSTIKLVPTQQEQGGISSLASKYGGLAAMAGINLGTGKEGNSVQYAVELMNSWPYLESFVDRFDLKPVLMGVEGWNPNTNELLYNEEVYNVTQEKWISKSSLFSSELKSQEPSSFDTFKKIKSDFVSIGLDEELGILSISVSHYSPQVAFDLTNLLTKDINEYFKKEDQQEAKASIEFIERKIRTTSNTGMLEVFYNMIESHTQTIMLTEINDEYLVKTLIPAKISDMRNKSEPRRALICILGALLGCAFSIVWVFLSSLRKKFE